VWTIGQILSFFFVGASVALIAWAVMVIASRIECERKEHRQALAIHAPRPLTVIL
jgi:hypothetical protein